MANIGIFGLEGSPMHRALEAGLWSTGRHTLTPQNTNAWTAAQEHGRFDAVVVHGARGRSGEIITWYKGHGRPVIMVDKPHLRAGEQYRVTPPQHDWLPDLPTVEEAEPSGDLETATLDELRELYTEEIGAPGRRAAKTLRTALEDHRKQSRPTFGGSRLDALGIELGEQQRTKGQGICILGQLGGDASHGMSSGEFREWATVTVKTLRALDTSPLVWRDHPLSKDRWAPPGVDVVTPPGESLAETLAGCWRAVTYCSGAGLEALAQGLSVVAEGPAVYGDLAGRLATWAACEKPTPADLRSLLVRVAHTQWTLTEIASGEAFRFLDLDVLR